MWWNRSGPKNIKYPKEIEKILKGIKGLFFICLVFKSKKKIENYKELIY